MLPLFHEITITDFGICQVINDDPHALEGGLVPQGAHVERRIAVTPEGSLLTPEVMHQIAVHGVAVERLAIGNEHECAGLARVLDLAVQVDELARAPQAPQLHLTSRQAVGGHRRLSQRVAEDGIAAIDVDVAAG